MKKSGFGCVVALTALLALLIISGAFYTVNETEQAIVTQFGKPVGDPIVEPGLKFKVPFLQKVNFFERRILEWDGTTTEMPTKDKSYIGVDTYARWTITDPLRFFEKLRDERTAQTRLDDILGSETRNTIARHELIEVIRTTKDRKPAVDAELAEAAKSGTVGVLIPIRKGRTLLEKEIFDTAKPKLAEFGVDLLDIRFKRINYNEEVQARIYERMVSERQQIAERFRSEGAGEAAKILGDKEKELRRIESEAYKIVETTRGEADAKASQIYANAFNRSPEAAEFYEFMRTLELYQKTLNDSTAVFTTDSDLFKYLKAVKPLNPSSSVEGVAPPAPAP
ncbi:MAG: HflC protein [Verrucomicrobiia bacterium Tous-C2TDCM]|nr:MAG: HflC protein [Verrucomicrobiae bacterium Tous-C2TDCM]